MRLGQRSGDRQAEARAPGVTIAGLVKAHQSIENPLAVSVRDAGTGVDDRHLGALVSGSGAHGDIAAMWGVSAGVVQQVGQNLRDPAGVGASPMIDAGRPAGAPPVAPITNMVGNGVSGVAPRYGFRPTVVARPPLDNGTTTIQPVSH
jgi:hypothetical protein